MMFVSLMSLVTPYTFCIKSLRLRVSYAAVRSINTAPVTFPLWNPSSIFRVRLRICAVQFLPGRNPASFRIRMGSTASERRL